MLRELRKIKNIIDNHSCPEISLSTLLKKMMYEDNNTNRLILLSHIKNLDYIKIKYEKNRWNT